MIIAWDNLGDAGTVTATTAESGFPAANVQHAQVSKKWHGTANGSAGDALIFDLGSSKTCGMVYLAGLNMTSSATIRVRSSDTDSTAQTNTEVDTGTVSLGAVTGYGNAFKTFTQTNSRYWRINLTDAAMTATKIHVGRVFLGPYWTPAYGHSYGWGVGWRDPSRQLRSHGGQIAVDARTQWRELQFALDWNNEAEMFTNAFALAQANGTKIDIAVIPQPTGSYAVQQSVWGLLQASEPIIHANVNIFRQKFTVMERL